MHTVLVVDDTADVRDLTSAVLRKEGYAVREACDGEDALETLADMPNKPCLILLDLMMPVMDGRTFLRTLRSEGSDTPVVVISAAARGDVEGADKTVCKPVTPDTIREIAHQFCDGR